MANGRNVLSLLFALLCSSVTWAQKPYTSEYWEENWRDWPRPRFDHRVDSFVAVENIILREFFNSNSNSSGELYRHYARFQYPNESSIRDHGSVIIQLPNYEFLEDIDFRVWQGGLLVYEARAAAIEAYYLDTLGADPFTKKMFVFQLSFPDLRPGSIVEMMVSCKGVPLPYRLSFEQSFPILTASQRIKILSAYPLRYHADSTVQVEQEEIWDYDLYKFSRKELQAYGIETSLSTAAADFPGVWLDWKDQVFYYDRDESDDWRELLPYLFYQGDLKDFVVYRNSLAEDFGRQQFYSSWIRPVRYFHSRGEEFQANSAYAEGRLKLSKAYAKRWIKVQEDLEHIVIDNAVPDFNEALRLVLKSQKKAVRSYLKDLPIEPPIFTEYGLLCSHLEKLFQYFRYDYRLALFGPARFAKPPANFASPWTAVARGLLFRKDSSEKWNFIIPGPYMSQFYGPNQLPPDLSLGWIQAFERGDSVPEIIPLAKTRVKNGFRHVFYQRKRAAKGYWQQRDTVHFNGAFRSILAAGYLRSDSVQDQLGYTQHQLLYQFEQSDSLLIGRPQATKLQDTLIYRLPLEEAWAFKANPSAGRSLANPMPFQALWQYRFETNDSLEIAVPLPPEISNSVFRFSYSWQRQESAWLLSFELDQGQIVIKPEARREFEELQAFFKQGLEFKVWSR